MFYSVALMLLFVIILLIFDRKSRYTWLFALMIAGAMIAFFFTILHLSVFADYGFYRIQNPLFLLDWRVFDYIKDHTSLPIVTNMRLINVGISVYLFGATMFNYEFSREVNWKSKTTDISRSRALLYMFVPLAGLILPDPSVSTSIYLLYHTSTAPEIVLMFYRCVEIVYKALVFVLLVRPSFILIKAISKIDVFFLQRRLWLFALGLFLANGIFYFFFFLSTCSISVNEAIISGFWIFENLAGTIPIGYMSGSALIFLVLAIVTGILLSCQMDVLITPMAERKIRKNILMLNEALCESLHSQKNLFFSMQILANKIRRTTEEQDIPELQRLQALVDMSLKRVTDMLNNLRDIKGENYSDNLLDIIDSAVRSISAPEYIELYWKRDLYQAFDMRGAYNRYCLEQALVNLLHNAVEAIQAARREKGRIRVELSSFIRWTVISVTDNGCGITHKEKQDIFTPHYSGKRGKMNWGLGLPYVYRVVKACLGQIRIDSSPNVYTTVVIMLPSRGAERIHRSRERKTVRRRSND